MGTGVSFTGGKPKRMAPEHHILRCLLQIQSLLLALCFQMSPVSGYSVAFKDHVSYNNELIPWGWVLLEKLIVSQVVKNFPSLLWNPKFQYLVHKTSPLELFLSQMGPVHVNALRSF